MGVAAFLATGTGTTNRALACSTYVNPTYVITDRCIKCKFQECVEVCPVDCIYEGENMLVIHPDECIECGVCEPECPADAIVPGTEPEACDWVEHNLKYAKLWPNITVKRRVPQDAQQWVGVPNKFELFSPDPGEGD